MRGECIRIPYCISLENISYITFNFKKTTDMWNEVRTIYTGATTAPKFSDIVSVTNGGEEESQFTVPTAYMAVPMSSDEVNVAVQK